MLTLLWPMAVLLLLLQYLLLQLGIFGSSILFSSSSNTVFYFIVCCRTGRPSHYGVAVVYVCVCCLFCCFTLVPCSCVRLFISFTSVVFYMWDLLSWHNWEELPALPFAKWPPAPSEPTLSVCKKFPTSCYPNKKEFWPCSELWKLVEYFLCRLCNINLMWLGERPLKNIHFLVHRQWGCQMCSFPCIFFQVLDLKCYATLNIFFFGT